MHSLALPLVQVAAGLALLILSAEWLTDACVKLAKALGVSPLVIGLTIVAFGTSAPELFVSIMAVIQSQPDIAVGNVVGSNIANIGLVLGLGAFACPFPVPGRIARIELPFLAVSVAGLAAAAYAGMIDRLSALLFLLFFIGYLYFLWHCRAGMMVSGSRGDRSGQEESPRFLFRGIIIAASMAGLVIGSRLLVSGSVDIARYFHCPELIIGLTLTAVGTSLPELASTIAAAKRKQGELIIGNVLGSNFANTCGVLGTAGLINPIPINHQVLMRDMPVMAVLSLALFPIMRRKQIKRSEGLCLLVAYFTYIAVLYLKK